MVQKLLFVVFVIIALAAWYLFGQNVEEEKYFIPPELEGEEGLKYFKETYSYDLTQAGGLCTSFFKGRWTDTPSMVGCSNMDGFLDIYCAFNEANDIKDVCDEISGVFACNSKEIYCVV